MRRPLRNDKTRNQKLCVANELQLKTMVLCVLLPLRGGGARNIARRSHTLHPLTPLGAPPQNMAVLRERRNARFSSLVFCRGGRYIEASRKRDPHDHSHCRSHNSVTKKVNPLLFLIRHATINAYQGKEVDMECARCGNVIIHSDYSYRIAYGQTFCSGICADTYKAEQTGMKVCAQCHKVVSCTVRPFL